MKMMVNLSRSNSVYHSAVLLLLLLAFGVRVGYLAAPSLWLDEAISANVAFGDLGDAVHHAKVDVHPPLYYSTLHLWAYIGHDEFTVRFLSVLANVLSGAIAFSLAYRMFDASSALLALLFFAISPFQVRYSQEARMYALVGLFVALIMLSVWLYAEASGRRALWLYIISASLGLYTHYQVGVLLIIVNLWIVIRLSPSQKSKFGQWLLAQIIVFFLFLPWLPNFISQLQRGGRSWVRFYPSLSLFFSPLFEFVWGEDFAPIAVFISRHGVIVAIFLLVLAATAGRKQISVPASPMVLSGLACVGTLALGYALSFKSNIFGAQYLFGASFGLYLFMAAVLGLLMRCTRWLALGLVLALVTSQTLALVNYYQPQNQRENWRGAVAYIKSNAGPNDVVGFHFDGPMAPYVYYADDELPALGFLSGLEISPVLSAGLPAKYDNVWLFEYLANLYDPKGMITRQLFAQGYLPVWHHNFSGVPLTKWEINNGLSSRLVIDFENSDGIRATWDHNLESQLVSVNDNLAYVSSGEHSIHKYFMTNSVNTFHYGGIDIGIKEMPFSFDFWLDTQCAPNNLYVYVYDAKGNFVATYHRDLIAGPVRQNERHTFTFFPGASYGGFNYLEGDPAKEPASLAVILEIPDEQCEANFYIDRLQSVLRL